MGCNVGQFVKASATGLDTSVGVRGIVGLLVTGSVVGSFVGPLTTVSMPGRCPSSLDAVFIGYSVGLSVKILSAPVRLSRLSSVGDLAWPSPAGRTVSADESVTVLVIGCCVGQSVSKSASGVTIGCNVGLFVKAPATECNASVGATGVGVGSLAGLGQDVKSVGPGSGIGSFVGLLAAGFGVGCSERPSLAGLAVGRSVG